MSAKSIWIEVQVWWLERLDGLGMLLSGVGRSLDRAGDRLCERASEHWRDLQPLIASETDRLLRTCPHCGLIHDEEGRPGP